MAKFAVDFGEGGEDHGGASGRRDVWFGTTEEGLKKGGDTGFVRGGGGIGKGAADGLDEEFFTKAVGRAFGTKVLEVLGNVGKKGAQ